MDRRNRVECASSGLVRISNEGSIGRRRISSCCEAFLPHESVTIRGTAKTMGQHMVHLGDSDILVV